MPLVPGTSLGPYTHLAPLGAGGMGEVYSALDPKLGRKVAIKVLPAHLASDPSALARFEREAKALGALSHPAILSIFDFGREGEIVYAVMELLEGRTLRDALKDGPLAPRRAAEIAAQVARGLAAAHEKGIIHRDLKPENLFLARNAVKVLDFGLAKTQGHALPANLDTRGVDSLLTGEGMLLGTVGYMAPEQVRGDEADARSDLFSLGIVLFEMLSGVRPFQGTSGIETLNAILKEDPPELKSSGRIPIPTALDLIVHHCLEKEPGHRFQSAMDLAFALEHLDSGITPLPSKARRGPWRMVAGLAGAALALAALGFAAGARRSAKLPTFRLLTHEQGTVGEARFIPGAPEYVFGAQWSGGSQVWYAQRLDQAGTRVVPGGEGRFLDVAANGESLGLADAYLVHGLEPGRLFTLPLQGGAKRPWLDKVWAACPDPKTGGIAAVMGEYGSQYTLEWPVGHALYQSPTTLRLIRIRGDRLALFQEQGDTFEDGLIQVVDRQGAIRTLAALSGVTGLAWSPDGGEVWVSTFRDGQSRFLGVDLKGQVRTLLNHAERLEIEDVDPAGRVLAALHGFQRQTFGRAPGETADHDLGWLDAQASMGISGDGTSVLLANLGDWSRADGSMFLRPTKGGPAAHAGTGLVFMTLSYDGNWIAAMTKTPQVSLVLIPARGGTQRTLPLPEFDEPLTELFPDGKTALVWGRVRGGPKTFYKMDLATGQYKTLSPPNCFPFRGQNVISPDGQWLAFPHADGTSKDGEQSTYLMRADGSDFHRAPELKRDEAVTGWGADSKSLYVIKRTGLPVKVERLDLATGRRSLALTLSPPDPAGIPGIGQVHLAPGGRAYAYNIIRKLSKLYLIEGLS